MDGYRGAEWEMVAETVMAGLSERLLAANLSPEFYGSWEHCSGSRKSVLAHAVGLGLLSGAVASVPGVEQVAIDVRLKTWDDADKRHTWQPDVVGYRRKGAEFVPVVYADLESPNSSDARVPEKDFGAYRRWLAANGHPAPYVLVVCLPNQPHGYWPLRYTRPDGCNYAHADGRQKLEQVGPFAYWTAAWREHLTPANMHGVTVLNLGNGMVEPVHIFDSFGQRN